MTSHSSSIILLTVLAVVAFFVYSNVIHAPAHPDPSIPIPDTTKEGTPLQAAVETKTKSASFLSAARPPIDLAAPAKTETATFAMG